MPTPYRWTRDPLVYVTLGMLAWLAWLDPLAAVCVLVGVALFEALLHRFTKRL